MPTAASGRTMPPCGRAIVGVLTTSMVAWVLCWGGTRGTRLHDQDVSRYGSHHSHEVIVEISLVELPCQGCGHQGSNSGRRTQEEPHEDHRVAGAVDIQRAVMPCDALVQAQHAAKIRFVISSDEMVTAEQTRYKTVSGSAFSDGIDRKVWVGDVVAHAQGGQEIAHRSVSMVWGDTCNAETFSLKMITECESGTTSISKTVPCVSQSSAEFCWIEASAKCNRGLINFRPQRLRATTSTAAAGDYSTQAARSRTSRRSKGRELQSSLTEVDVMLLYTDAALALMGGATAGQMETTLMEVVETTNEAFSNSEIPLHFSLVHAAKIQYQSTESSSASLTRLSSSSEIANLRDTYAADLVQIFHDYGDECGNGFTNTELLPELGYSVVNPTCIDTLASTHEFGHAFGCSHNREDSEVDTKYSHGHRVCTSTDRNTRFRSVMSYDCDGVPVINYFSNPDVLYDGQPTGTATEDNARTIKENMEAVAKFRWPKITAKATRDVQWEPASLPPVVIDKPALPANASV